MKILIETIKEIKPRSSFLIVTDKFDKEFILKELEDKLNAWRVNIGSSVKSSFKDFLEIRGIKYAKSSSTEELAYLTAKAAKENNKHLIFNFKDYLDGRNIKAARNSLIAVYNELTQNPNQDYTYYPLAVVFKPYYRDFLENEAMWRYKPYFPETDFKVKAGLWIEKYPCWRCGKETKVLVGIKIENHCIPVSDLNEKAIDFIRENFPEEFKALNLKKVQSFNGFVTNICSSCNAKIGNFYLFDDFYVEQMPFGFEDIKPGNCEYLKYDEVKKIIEV